MLKRDLNNLAEALGLVLNLIAWGIAWLFPRHEGAAILHYTSTVGIDFVGEGRHIMVLPAVGTLVLVVNMLVGRVIAAADRRAATLLAVAVPIVQLLLLAALLFLRFVNT